MLLPRGLEEGLPNIPSSKEVLTRLRTAQLDRLRKRWAHPRGIPQATQSTRIEYYYVDVGMKLQELGNATEHDITASPIILIFEATQNVTANATVTVPGNVKMPRPQAVHDGLSTHCAVYGGKRKHAQHKLLTFVRNSTVQSIRPKFLQHLPSNTEIGLILDYGPNMAIVNASGWQATRPIKMTSSMELINGLISYCTK